MESMPFKEGGNQNGGIEKDPHPRPATLRDRSSRSRCTARARSSSASPANTRTPSLRTRPARLPTGFRRMPPLLSSIVSTVPADSPRSSRSSLGSSILPSWSRIASMAHLAGILHLSQQPNPTPHPARRPLQPPPPARGRAAGEGADRSARPEQGVVQDRIGPHDGQHQSRRGEKAQQDRIGADSRLSRSRARFSQGKAWRWKACPSKRAATRTEVSKKTLIRGRPPCVTARLGHAAPPGQGPLRLLRRIRGPLPCGPDLLGCRPASGGCRRSSLQSSAQFRPIALDRHGAPWGARSCRVGRESLPWLTSQAFYTSRSSPTRRPILPGDHYSLLRRPEVERLARELTAQLVRNNDDGSTFAAPEEGS